MEFELTIRGNTEELPPLLDLLGKGALQFNSPTHVGTEEPTVSTIVPWRYGKQEELWNDLSDGAKELMTHLAVRCREGELDLENWVCDPDYEYGVNRCDGEICEEFMHRQMGDERVQVETLCGINAQSIGARIANITRNLSDPKFKGLAYPITKYLATVDQDTESNKSTSYQLIPSWDMFVFFKWGQTQGYPFEFSPSEYDTVIG